MTLLYTELHRWPSCRRLHLQCDLSISKRCLQRWSTRHIEYSLRSDRHACRNCSISQFSSKGGKVSGKKAVESGQIEEFIRSAASPAAREKARSTARRKGKRAFTSKVEDAVYEKCVNWFGHVKRWQYIRRRDGKLCNVDMLIVDKNVYVEVDGSYWHGLDRPYHELSNEIRAKYDHDRLLDDHCKESGIRLIRVTDREVYASAWDSIRSRIES